MATAASIRVVKQFTYRGVLRDFSRSRYARPVDLKALEPDHQKMLFEGTALINNLRVEE